MNFGALRVLNDDTVEAGMGFGTHPHRNMEIVSIPLEGDLEHKDSMGNNGVIKQGDVQVMSAGSGISHSEFNHSKTSKVKFLQIWIVPKKQNVEPRYDQQSISKLRKLNEFYQILSPTPSDAGVWIHQDAWFNMADLDKGKLATYKLNNVSNGVYAFIMKGSATIGNHALEERDGLEIKDVSSFDVESNNDETKVLLIEVPILKL